MHSAIISAIAGFFCSFWRVFKESTIYCTFDKIYSAFSNSWQKSVIVEKIKNFGNIISHCNFVNINIECYSANTCSFTDGELKEINYSNCENLYCPLSMPQSGNER